MNRISASFLSIVILSAIVLVGCGEDSNGVGAGWNTVEADGFADEGDSSGHVDPSLLTPEADGTFSMAETPTPVPSAIPIPEATPTPAPTSTPEPTFEDIYREDVIGALDTYFAAYHSRSQSALDSVTTAATSASEFTTVEYMKNSSAMTRGWRNYPDIDIVEVTHLKCDEVLCKISYDAVSNPPSDSRDPSFDFSAWMYFRLVNGVWLEDHTHDTWSDEWDSTHRE